MFHLGRRGKKMRTDIEFDDAYDLGKSLGDGGASVGVVANGALCRGCASVCIRAGKLYGAAGGWCPA